MIRMVAGALAPLSDPDFWWHLRLGQRIMDEGISGPVDDWAPFASGAWAPTQLLPDVVAAKAYSWWGLPAIAWMLGVALIVIVILCYFVCRQRSGPLPAALVTCLATVGMAGSLSPRPQVLSFILVLVVVHAWLRTESDLRARWWLVPVTWVWAMCHGMWFLSPAVGGATVLGIALSRRLGFSAWLRIALVPVACFAVSALTPVGPRLLLGPLIVNGRTEFIAEWQRTSFDEAASLIVLFMILATAALWIWRRDWTPGQVLLLAQAGAWLFLAERTVAVAAAMSAPLLAGALGSAMRETTDVRDGSGRVEVRFLAVVTTVCLAALTLAVPSTAARPGLVPTGLDGSLSRLPAGTVVFNDDKLGGWLLLEHPNVSPVLDGLSDAYPVSQFETYQDIVGLTSGWQAELRGLGAEAALLPDDSPVEDALERAGWTREGEDRGYVLLRKSAGAPGPQP